MTKNGKRRPKTKPGANGASKKSARVNEKGMRVSGASENPPAAPDELQAEILAAERENPRIQKLLEVGQQKGVVSVDDIIVLFPEAEEDVAVLDEAHAALLEAGIEIVEHAVQRDADSDEADDPLAAEKARVRAKIKKIRRRPKGSAAKDGGLAAMDVDDTIGLYLKEVGGVPLLTKDQEVWLAKRMEKAEHAREELASDKRVYPRRRRELDAIIEDGLAAREHLVTANSRLVISVAKKYIGRGVPFLDLIQEGNIGLLRAAKKFDYHRGHKFSTYATWWIRQAVTRAIADQGRTIRVPVHMGDQINKLLRVSHALTQKLGREPTMEELAELLEVAPKKVEDMVQIARRPLSLEMPTDDLEDSMLGDFIEDEDSPAPAEAAIHNLLQRQIQDALTGLPPREVRILQLRYGLLDGESYTLEEVGRKMGVTRERVRQIEAQALGRLRNPGQKSLLEGFLREY
ncbi:MAG: sigma-70 family RNA polymerase sigma factor [Anaerolineales bacterium]|jgi:RNA polymerase primary sigma factor|nr:sigma-70 family RNA polymerase sigma factor [Anaerolineales bacterium]MDP7644644.1 sigma-70 family RNA polymerase sigma factor [Anaerolineales bacterium]HJN41793.1 sigma-70 family RNA polymerase sigma factor [Anaerolineales bacterium]|tara:strand:- start:626 stop:2005 length:1380 start_codon:yes stop_codon:yes gene_type:complete